MHVAHECIERRPSHLVAAYQEMRPSPELEAEIRLDWRCNARCLFCAVWKYERKSVLSTAVWKEKIRELAEVGMRFALFTGGEPLMYPGFFEAIEYADSLAVRSGFITNGSLLTAERARRLADLQHLEEIVVSVDSPLPRVHDSVRQFPGLFDLAVEAMGHIRENAKDVRLVVNTVVAKDTVSSLGELLSLPVKPDKITVFPVELDLLWLEWLSSLAENGWARWARLARHQALTQDMLDQARNAILQMRPQAHDMGIELDALRLFWKGPFSGICAVPLGHLVLQPDGDVYPCCHLQDEAHRLGQLSRQSLREVLDGETYRGSLASLRPVRLGRCRACSRYRAFNQAFAQLIDRSDRPGPCPSGDGG